MSIIKKMDSEPQFPSDDSTMRNVAALNFWVRNGTR